MDNLKQLDAQALSEIIKEFNGKIFQSEAQFQFELAWKLNEKYGNGDDLAVELEDRMVEKDVKRKYYTDIVVKQGDYRVAIELKYKTAEYENKNENLYLFNHGAVDLGRYDYIWDVHRIELLKGVSKSKDFGEEKLDVPKQKRCKKGFAVLLTNEKKYWEEKSKEDNIPIDYQFLFGEKQKQLFSDVLDWKKDDEKEYPLNYPKTVLSKKGEYYKPTSRAHPIRLNKAYHYEWYNYRDASSNEKNDTFKFVIIEV